jgi:Flp pilus assembly protein TadD
MAHHNLGAALMRLGRISEAEAHFREVLRLRPNSAEAQRSLDAVIRSREQMQ